MQNSQRVAAVRGHHLVEVMVAKGLRRSSTPSTLSDGADGNSVCDPSVFGSPRGLGAPDHGVTTDCLFIRPANSQETRLLPCTRDPTGA